MKPEFSYSGSTRGFYATDVHTPEQIPNDAVPITEDYWQALLQGQSAGYMIAPNEDGYPVLVEYPPLSPEELAEQIRTERDRLLKASDWTQLPDIPQATKDLWVSYRQALRDVTAQESFPATVEWPTAPSQGGV